MKRLKALEITIMLTFFNRSDLTLVYYYLIFYVKFVCTSLFYTREKQVKLSLVYDVLLILLLLLLLLLSLVITSYFNLVYFVRIACHQLSLNFFNASKLIFKFTNFRKLIIFFMPIKMILNLKTIHTESDHTRTEPIGADCYHGY